MFNKKVCLVLCFTTVLVKANFRRFVIVTVCDITRMNEYIGKKYLEPAYR